MCNYFDGIVFTAPSVITFVLLQLFLNKRLGGLGHDILEDNSLYSTVFAFLRSVYHDPSSGHSIKTLLGVYFNLLAFLLIPACWHTMLGTFVTTVTAPKFTHW